MSLCGESGELWVVVDNTMYLSIYRIEEHRKESVEQVSLFSHQLIITVVTVNGVAFVNVRDSKGSIFRGSGVLLRERTGTTLRSDGNKRGHGHVNKIE